MPKADPTVKRTTKKQRIRAAKHVVKDAPWWRRPAPVAGVIGILVVAVVAVLLVVGSKPATTPTTATICTATTLSAAASTTPSSSDFGAAPSDVVSAITQPSTTVLTAVGAGGQTGDFNRICTGTPLRGAHNLPAVVYVGGEFCPFCAAERWSLAVAVSRFGTLSNLRLMESSATDTDASTNTLTFHGTTYASSTIDFQPVELADRNEDALESPAPAVATLFETVDQPPYTSSQEGFPFIDIGGRYVLDATSYDPAILQGLTWSQIAADLSDPSSPVAKAVLGNANIMTAAICSTTNNAPAAVCTTPLITSLESTLASQPLVGSS